MIKKIYLAFFFLWMFTSCYDSNFLSHENASYLTVKVFSFDGKPANGAVINFYDLNGAQGGIGILTDTTGPDGMVKTRLLQGNYSVNCRIDSLPVYYQTGSTFQMIGGEDKTIELYPFTQRGGIHRKIVNTKKEPLIGLHVVLIPRYFNSNAKFQDLLKLSFKESITDSSGFMYFPDLPLGMYFTQLLYYTESRWSYYNSGISATNPIEEWSWDETIDL